MAKFYVYWNAVVRKIKIHRSECGACKGGKGMHEGKIGEARGTADDWEKAKTYQEARAIADHLRLTKTRLSKPKGRLIAVFAVRNFQSETLLTAKKSHDCHQKSVQDGAFGAKLPRRERRLGRKPVLRRVLKACE